jgi:hypothetical protein
MPLWGKSDAASNSTLYALSQVGSVANSTTQTAFFGNTTADAFITDVTVGQFGVDTAEVQAKRDAGEARPASPGWAIRTVKGSRVMYETLVAMSGSGGISTDASDDTVLPDYNLRITTQPASTSANGSVPEDGVFTVVARSTPSGASFTYAWTYANGDPIQAGANVGTTTAATLTVNTAVETANVDFKVTVSATGAIDVVSSNATLTVTA